MKMNIQPNFYLVICVTSLFILSRCNSGSKRNQDCEFAYRKAEGEMDSFLKDSSKEHLYASLSLMQVATECDKTKKSAISFKISLLNTLKQYEGGFKFTDSLNENDFLLRYQKGMWHKFFLSKMFESKEDTASRDSVLIEVDQEIQKFIDTEIGIPADKVNENAYGDLFSLRKIYIPQKTIDIQLDSLKIRHPAESDFFDGLETTLRKAPSL